MNRFTFFALFLGTAGIGVLAAASQQRQQGNPAEEPVSVRYARASLELARIELQKHLEQEKKAPRIIPAIVIERTRMNVKVAETQLEQALQPATGGTIHVQVRYAEERAKIAELEYEQAKKARLHNPNAVLELEVERLGLVAETARLRLAMWRDPVYLPSLLDQMQWQLDRLSEEIIDLNKRLEKDKWMPR